MGDGECITPSSGRESRGPSSLRCETYVRFRYAGTVVVETSSDRGGSHQVWREGAPERRIVLNKATGSTSTVSYALGHVQCEAGPRCFRQGFLHMSVNGEGLLQVTNRSTGRLQYRIWLRMTYVRSLYDK